MAIMITNQMIDHVIEVLADSNFCKGRWSNPYAETQEDGQYLFVSVCVTEKSVNDETKNDIADLLASTVPPGGESTIGNWMVVFLLNDKVTDSWAPYDL